MNTEEIKKQARKEFDERFELALEQDPELRGIGKEIKSLIDSLIDKTVQMTEDRVKFLLNDLQETFYTEIQKVDNRYKDSSIGIQQAKWSHSNEIRLIFSKLKSNFLESLRKQHHLIQIKF